MSEIGTKMSSPKSGDQFVLILALYCTNIYSTFQTSLFDAVSNGQNGGNCDNLYAFGGDENCRLLTRQSLPQIADASTKTASDNQSSFKHDEL